MCPRTAGSKALGAIAELLEYALEGWEGQTEEGMVSTTRKSGNEGDDATLRDAIKTCPKLHVIRGSLRTSSPSTPVHILPAAD